MANIPAFKAEIEAVISNTTNLDNPQKVLLGTAYTSLFANEYADFRTRHNLSDNNTSKAKFVAAKVFQELNGTVKTYNARQDVIALPPPAQISPDPL